MGLFASLHKSQQVLNIASEILISRTERHENLGVRTYQYPWKTLLSINVFWKFYPEIVFQIALLMLKCYFLALVAFFVKPKKKKKNCMLQCHLSIKRKIFSSLIFFFFLMIENTVSLLLIEPIHLWQMQAVLQIRQVCQQGHPQKKLLMLQYIPSLQINLCCGSVYIYVLCVCSK